MYAQWQRPGDRAVHRGLTAAEYRPSSDIPGSFPPVAGSVIAVQGKRDISGSIRPAVNLILPLTVAAPCDQP